ncbi:vacuolar sorting protein 39 [Lactuca sativa]|uniref:CNH domain-containing protein n=1 Tax=Lactuca sativa TaxID=4236 RepID=A0A9R1VPV1_LACSA|nr:vacuolar sorting protein 39 [Lactuca sativa]KAJ0208707.1 hypothetical protein LSAT_V11C400215310 [Lactuca sativa]
MVHTAYDSRELLNDCPKKINAVEYYGAKLLLACSDGSLQIYGSESANRSSSSDRLYQTLELKKELYVLERNVNGFSKKQVWSMELLASRELLLSLSESIAIHRLPNLEPVTVISKAKGASAYSWEDRRGFLCFARQKRVCIFRHDGVRGFVEVKEFGVPDTVRSMSWCGENICVGVRREYTILNATNGALYEIFPWGRIAPPVMVPLPSGELLLGKDNLGVLVDQNGKLIQEGRICWSEPPSRVVIQKPYVIALLPKHIEIRSLRVPYPLIQTIVLRNVRHIQQGNNGIIVSLERCLFGLFPVPLGAQIVQLTASGNFEEALVLCKMLPPEDSSLRASKEQSIHIRYAHYLFENDSYEEAMYHFAASQVEITYVLSLYPSIVLPKPVDKSTDVSGESTLSRVNSGTTEYYTDSSPSSQISQMESDDIPALEPKKMNHNTLTALIKYLKKKRPNIVGKAAAEGTEEVVSDAVGQTTRSKKSNKGRVNIPTDSGAREIAGICDTALLQALLLTGQIVAVLELLKGFNYCDMKICEELLQKGNHDVCLLGLYKYNSMHREALKLLHELVEDSKLEQPKITTKNKFKPEMIIDYLKPLCGIDHMLVLEFSTFVLESCPTKTIELFLSGNIPADLVNSYLKQHAPTLRATYLEQMLSMNEDGISPHLQNEMVQIYLSEVLDWHADLTAQNKWDEKLYIPPRRKLITALQGISEYNPEAFLKRIPPDALYEERAILLGKMNQHELALSIYVHKLHVPESALSYCDRVYELGGAHQQYGKAQGNIYLTLMQVYMNPRKTTKNIEKRITNLVTSSSTGNLKSAWSSVRGKGKGLGKKIVEIESAEDSRMKASSGESGRSDYDTDDVIEERSSTVMLDEVLDVLSQRWDRLHGAKTVRLLPKETKLQRLFPSLGPLMKKTSESCRNFQVIKSLRQCENLQVKDDLYKQRKGELKITGDSVCSLCNKKIGTSVFAVYPNGNTIVHFVCFRDSQNMKATRKGSFLRKR